MKYLILILTVLTLAACGFESVPTVAVVGGATVTPTPVPLAESIEAISHDNINRIEPLGQLVGVDTPTTVFAYDISIDGARLAGLNNTQLLSWDLVTGALVFTTDRLEATRVFYSPDKTEIYTITETGLVNVTNDRGVFQTSFQGHNLFNASVLAYYRDDGWLALGGTDGTVKVWDTAERTSLATIEAHPFHVNTLAFSNDGTLLATGGDEGVVKIWDWETRTQVTEFSINTVPLRLMFSPDDTQLAISTLDNILLYSVADATQSITLATGERGSGEVMLYSPDGRFLVNGGGIPNMQVWDPHSGTMVALIPGFGNQRLSADFSPDSTMLLTSMYNGGVALWDMTQITGETINRAELPLGVNTILNLAWTDDSRLMLFLDALGTIYVWGISPQNASPTETPAQ
ncbi:MAG: hypothetical protein U0694_05625 [Anaerolineae bacterium]